MLDSIGQIWDSQELLLLINKSTFKLDELKNIHENKKFNLIKLHPSLNLCLQCGWLELSKDNKIITTKKGDYLIDLLMNKSSSNNEKIAGRIQLSDYIKKFRPKWSLSLKHGRRKILSNVEENIKHIFTDIELYDENIPIINTDVINWWDNLALSSYTESQKNKVKYGRIGENLTFEFEFERCKVKPEWISIDDNDVGYDILSIYSDEYPSRKMCIETKTTSIGKNMFYISKNEWNTSLYKNKEDYKFYLWILDSYKLESDLLIIDSHKLINDIPLNQGQGEWENSSIYIKKINKSKYNKIIFDDFSDYMKKEIKQSIQLYLDKKIEH